MHRLVLLNDVHTKMDEYSRLIGSRDLPASEEGLELSLHIAKSFSGMAPKIDAIVCSDAARISRLVHWIRMLSKGEYLTRKKPKFTEALRERCFGVFEGTPQSPTSEIFTHSRICPEGGESVAECRDRSVYVLKTYFEKHNQTVLAVSHPYTCQIITNFFLGKASTYVNHFWQHKGAMVWIKKEDKPGWEFDRAFNLVSDVDFELEDLYS